MYLYSIRNDEWVDGRLVQQQWPEDGTVDETLVLKIDVPAVHSVGFFNVGQVMRKGEDGVTVADCRLSAVLDSEVWLILKTPFTYRISQPRNTVITTWPRYLG